MKIIFLDVDGVLNNSTTSEQCGKYMGIDNTCLSTLKEVIDNTGTEIVLISTWKEYWIKDEALKFMQDKLAKYLDMKFAEKGLVIYDKVKDEIKGKELTRGESILEYIARTKPSAFAIVDDMEFDYDECGLNEFYVKTNSDRGLSEADKTRIIGLLGKSENEERKRVD